MVTSSKKNPQDFKLLSIPPYNPFNEHLYHHLKNGFNLSVGSYNILASCYISPDMKRLVHKDYLDFEYRSKMVASEIGFLNPDIFFLQECDNLKETYQKLFENLGFGIIAAQRPGKSDYEVILYKKSVLEPVSQATLDFNKGHPFVNLEVFKKANVGIFAKFRHIKTKQTINALGAHLHWNFQIEQVRYLQTVLILKFLSENCEKEDAVFWGGDLNSKPTDNNISYIKDRSPPKMENIAHKDPTILEFQNKIFQEAQRYPNKFKWDNLYESYGTALGTKETFPAFTSYAPDFKEPIDYIFYSNNKINALQLLQINTQSIQKEVMLPNAVFPSDHRPIMGVFRILNRVIR